MIKNHILYTPFSDWRFEVSKASGSYIWDEKGRKMIDFTSGWNVTNLGWNNPEISKAVMKQLKKNTYASMWSSDPIQEEYAKEFARSLPKELSVFARATGGTEANEEAIKTARAYTGRKNIVGFRDSYHGQSYSTLAIGYLPNYTVVKSIAPMPDGYLQLDYPRVRSDEKNPQSILSEFGRKLEEMLAKEDVAAVVAEAGIITGWGSTFVAPSGFLAMIRALTKKYGTLLILDEVGTGFSRCGKLFGMELENVVPDIGTFAKGISNGVAAMGAMVTTETIAQTTFEKTNLVSTFGWTPIGCAASLKTLQIHKRERMWEKAEKDGEHIVSQLKKELSNHMLVEDVNGIGMEIGVHFVKSEKTRPLVLDIERVAQEKGLHIVCDMEQNIQLMPPLTTERSVLDKGLEIFISVVRSFKA